MKSEEKLRRAYEIQKKQFDEAETRRRIAARKHYDEVKEKVEKLNRELQVLTARINNPKEFCSFEEFLERCKKPSNEP